MRRILLLALALAALSPAAVDAQDRDLARALDNLAALWARGDAARLAAVGLDQGLELEIHGETFGRVSGRKAAAALRQFFAGCQTISVHPSMISRVTGADDRAFGELTWIVRTRGSAVPERSTVFVGLVREEHHWRVSQIRVLR